MVDDDLLNQLLKFRCLKVVRVKLIKSDKILILNGLRQMLFSQRLLEVSGIKSSSDALCLRTQTAFVYLCIHLVASISSEIINKCQCESAVSSYI